MANAALPRKQGAKAYLRKLGKDIWRDGDAYLLVVPVLLYFFLFHGFHLLVLLQCITFTLPRP